ncbi:serine protease 40-like [Odocoileus virginianus]|uniref:Serine protease 40-like n=1 Tax=Odocoileus virginianus TaxID=9874 RepID=A0A6J0X7P5_ODOVR
MPRGPREPRSAQSDRRCRTGRMEITAAEGSGPGWKVACTLAVVLLCLHSLLPHTKVAGTTDGPPVSAVSSCGKTAVTGRITGGKNTVDKRWPWQAGLLYQGTFICGASLISDYWVISAAHCFQMSHNPTDYKILLGYYQLEKPTSYSQLAAVYRLFIHADYNKRYFQESDITLLQLYHPAKFSDSIRTVCLPEANIQSLDLIFCWITGWGMVTEQEFLPTPKTLQEAEVGFLDNSFCESILKPPETSNQSIAIKDGMLCAADSLTGKSVCRGDSGGPLVCNLNDTWYLMGLSSFSTPCEKPIGPSIFTKVSYYNQWISEKQKSSPNPDPSTAPAEEKPPALFNFNSLGNVHKPRSFLVLAASQTFLLLLIFL